MVMLVSDIATCLEPLLQSLGRKQLLKATGDLNQASVKTKLLLEQALVAGEKAYERADYGIALAYFLSGRVLKETVKTAKAVIQLLEAQQRFSVITASTNAKRMTSVCLTDQGDCLLDLGQVDEAIAKYQQMITLATELEDIRQQAVGLLKELKIVLSS